jgi:hypothetical protein
MNFNWRCPFCNQNATIGNANYLVDDVDFKHGYKNNEQSIRIKVTVCPNIECKEVEIVATQLQRTLKTHQWSYSRVKEWKLTPDSNARPYPDYIPRPIIQDYTEACSILTRSPKAAATLSRRCLQGMIRDFWNIKEATLFKEIDAIQDKLDPETFEAIDSLRKLGNIGAHMEKDIDTIIEVDEDEAGLLVQLIESLFEEWYMKRHQRQEKMARIKAVAVEKDAERKASQVAPQPSP